MNWFIYAFLSALTAALVAIFGKLGLTQLDSTLATTIRSIIMTLFLIVTSLTLKKFDGFSLSQLSNRDIIFITLSGIAGALSWLFYFKALQIGFVSKVVAIDRLSLIIAVILSALILGESITLKGYLGMILMFIGALLLTINNFQQFLEQLGIITYINRMFNR
jgi:bacterial/archaeal transporter family protein